MFFSFLFFMQKTTGAAGGAIPRRRNGKVFLGMSNVLISDTLLIFLNKYDLLDKTVKKDFIKVTSLSGILEQKLFELIKEILKSSERPFVMDFQCFG